MPHPRLQQRLTPTLSRVRTDDGSWTLRDDDAGETFHSESGAVQESRFVFLENSGIARQLNSGQSARVLEIGFGTGLNFLVTAHCAKAARTPLEYIGIDRRVLDLELLDQLQYENVLGDAELLRDYRQGMKDAGAIGKVRHLTLCESLVRLEMWEGSATEFTWPGVFDAVYQDAFSPAASPDLWTPDFFIRLRAVLRPNGRLVTYCVCRPVKDALVQAGFSLQVVAGPQGGKRNVLIATVGPRKPDLACL